MLGRTLKLNFLYFYWEIKPRGEIGKSNKFSSFPSLARESTILSIVNAC
jgi:hypothetical protein